MVSASSSSPCCPSRLSSQLLIVLISIALIATTGCGSSGSSSTPKLSGNTAVTVVLSSTANDQVTQFAVQFKTLTLTSQSGNIVTLVSSQQPSEFMHLNGGIEPLTTATIPQDVYTSAAVTVSGAVFVCLAQDPAGGVDIDNYSIVNQGPTVNLASPITVTGSSMALLLDMKVSDSAVIPVCDATAFGNFSMAPTFNLAPLALSSSPTNSENGKVLGLKAEVASVGTTGSNLTLSAAEGKFGTRTISVTSDNSTVYQGVSGFSALTLGLFLDMDGAIQPDGSLLATRIAVEDPSAINQSSGPLMFIDTLVPDLTLYARTEIGALLSVQGAPSGPVYIDTPYFNFSNAVFQISGQFTNFQNLPFVPSFTASNMVAGQNVDIASLAFSMSAPNYTTATTITLIPQTINGTIQSISSSGSFTVYTVSLASYDLFPQLAVQQGQTTLLANPGEVQVYVDSNTQTLNTQPLAAGSTLRFYGLVFNDSGTLRMDCGQVSDGVQE